MNMLVTGATGFIGSWLLKRLCSEHTLYCPARHISTLPSHSNIHGIEQDLATPIDEARLPSSMDAIIHLAQSKHFRQFPDRAKDIFKVNTESTLQWLEYGRRAKIRTFVLASSGGVCGFQNHPILETDPPDLMNFYLASKYAAECFVNAYADHFTTVNLRYFFVYGEGQRDMFLPSLATRVLTGNPVTLSGQHGIALNPIHVSDAIEATSRALEVTRQETINIAGEESTSIRDLAELVGELSGKKPVYQYDSDKGSLSMVANIEKMKLKLGVSPKVRLREGLERLVKDLVSEGRAKSR